ncbi:hypothetical protein BDS110ZK14_81040 [Bradyrhizobium diazoefficiens]|jgi:hypothetical protein|nr:hypothetical protein BwSG20_65630 [Bradyrhizobium ottawaense]
MGMWQALQATARQPERNGARDFREELCGILGDEAIRRRGFPALG